MRAVAQASASAWVSANAGSGKTYVLVTRLVALMLSGVAPEKLLCLTYTRSAAAEMQERLFALLSDWTLMSDAKLAAEFEARLEMTPDAQSLRLARTLFARALETPGGLRIQTIHGFCESVLRRFPIEAGLSPQFKLLDEQQARAMQADLVRAQINTDDPERRASIARLTRHVAEDAMARLAGDILNHRDKFPANDAIEARLENIARSMDLPDWAFDVEALLRAHAEAYLPEVIPLIQALSQALAKSDRAQGERLESWAERARGGAHASAWLFLESVFMTKEGNPRARLVTAAFAGAHASVAEALIHQADDIAVLRNRLNAAQALALTGDIYRFAADLITAYETAKTRLGVLDYDDLIVCTNRLLNSRSATQWVLFKIDRGLEHILVDEAQDTSPAQWQVIAALAEEFFAGDAAHAEPRTVFAVGDEKQSIYSFQGADPAGFEKMRAHFAEKTEAAGGTMNFVPLIESRRSAPEILAVVDLVFAEPARAEGLMAAGTPVHHIPHRLKDAGYVELWEPEAVETPDTDLQIWEVPDAMPDETARRKLARRIAAKISGLINAPDSQVTPGDILILVRRRDAFVEDMIRALKQETPPIEVAGADRMNVMAQIAVKDLLAGAEFALNSDDDLALACFLRSPLGGVGEHDLFALAHGRQGSLWRALVDASDAENAAPVLCAARRRLDWLRREADYLPPYDYFARFLSEQGAHAALSARLGVEINDPIGELLNLALAYESQQVPSLQGFLHWLAQGEQSLKRDMDVQTHAVRVMTVHGAKGLEAPIVFLPDTCANPVGHRPQSAGLYFAADGDVLWRANADMRDEYGKELQDRLDADNLEESRRLLYVAMTRARDRLYVGGYLNKRGTPPSAETWYAYLHASLGTDDNKSQDADGRTIWSLGDEARAGPQRNAPSEPPTQSPDVPAWARIPAARGPSAVKKISPSQLRPLAPAASKTQEEKPDEKPTGGLDARVFGTHVHALLEKLPSLPGHAREAAAQTYMARFHAGVSAADCEAICAAALGVLEHPDMAPVFFAPARAEIALVGQLALHDGQKLALSGRVDRYIENEDEIMLIDFKTGTPDASGDIGPALMMQMAVYRDLVARAKPDKKITCGIVWTQIARLDQLAASDLDAALEDIRTGAFTLA
ncbi:MAG: double-strand break repair helicase AddA [Pseudomonadota bacterium]|nr:double-strand break repair helicase AddA [Pseudomonadota bacterium]